MLNFFQWALLRQPNSTEATYWHNILRAAFPHGHASVMLATRELGKTLFESNEYAARGRSNYWYVYDLYKTYLMRDPDQGGWDFWTSQVPSMGRENVRRAFEFSVEYSNLVSTLAANGSINGTISSLLTARVDPYNQPGKPLQSRSAVWNVTVLSLPGRAGLDLGLTLAQASTVFTRSGPYLYFDEDTGSPSPGFRLGFPTVQEISFNAALGKRAFLLITSAGSRVELRQVGTSNTYEAADSSYLQLIDYGSSLLVRTTDGTQLTYNGFNNEYRVVQVKDRNGNFLTVNNNSIGQITSITDTLGRVVNFNYDINSNLLSITQSWGGPNHTWATFGWGTHSMQTSFSNVQVVGAPNNSQWPVLTQVGFPDGSRFNFEYTNWLQVSVIRRYTADNVQRSYQVNQYETPADNCPRLTHTRVWAENWTGLNGVPSEVVTQYADLSGVRVVTAPDGTIYKEFYGTGWQRGLVTQSEVWSGGVRKKWTTVGWTQDNTGVSYELNPRVIETNVYDAEGNRKRKVIEYGGYAQWGLPNLVREYAANGGTEIRHTFTDYNLSPAYLDRRIIGLVSAVHVSNTSQWQTKITYTYDEPTRIEGLPAAPTQHDSAFSTSFLARGNATTVTRWDVTDISNAAKALSSQVVYKISGTVSKNIDAAGHQSTVAYGDSFSDEVNRNTFAYPTTVTDADGHSSYFKYNFNFGAQTRRQGPPPQYQSQGIIQTIEYDSIGRLHKVTTTNNNAYTKYQYGNNNLVTLASVNNVADEFYQNEVFDGLGRTVGMASLHPGSTGGYKAQLTVYDLMGRTIKQSNPTEINGWWTPAGDDAAGWIYTQQTYDWQGRPLVTTNTDGTTKEASYGGCGCAGGAVVTLTDEGTISGGVAKRRQQKLYSDVLGRTVKTEVLNWQGGSVYSATVNTYNARDQVTQIRQYAGAEGSGTYQDTTMTYDGHGRLKTRKLPEQNVGTATVWDYNADDTIQKITDSRGASATFSYNGRHLTTNVTHALSGQSPISVTFGYDSVGNRTSMSHTVNGILKDSVSYSYDQLSRLTAETKYIAALAGYPMGGNYTINYGYTLSGQLASVTDPFGSTTNLSYDVAGRTSSVTGAFSGPNYTYANNVAYRAWGAVKSATLGGLSQTVSYNSRLQPTQFRLTAQYASMRYDYNYFNDGKLREIKDLDDQVGNPQYVQFHYMSRAYSYDHAGRVASVGQVPNYNVIPPFSGIYGYDAFNNLTSRYGNYALNSNQSDTATYTNNRRNGWNYNAEGRIISSADNSDSGGSSTRTWSYNAAGALVSIAEIRNWQTNTDTLAYDGDGKLIYEAVNSVSNYLIQSTVLGRVLTKLTSTGGKHITYVPANGLVFPQQNQNPGFTPFMSWVHRDALGIQERQSNSQYKAHAYDPFGSLIHNVQPPSGGPPPYVPFFGATYGGASWSSFVNANNFGSGCYSAQNRNADLCNDRMRQVMGDAFVDNLPGSYPEMYQAEYRHAAWVWNRGTRSESGNSSNEIDYSGTIPTVRTNNQRTVPGLWVLRFGFFEPQNPADAERIARTTDWAKQQVDRNYDDCLRRLGGAPAPGRNQSADILSVSSIEGIDATLLAVTWGREASFDYNPVANFRPEDGGWDVGPGQISTTYYNNSRFTAGLPDAFGSGFSETVQFNGHSFQNLRATARAYTMDILSRSTSRADAAGLFRAGRRRDRRGRIDGRYETRVNEFNTWRGDFTRGGYDAFFHCLRNGP